MELKETLLKRRSVRKFTNEKVNEEEIETLLHAAMSGPTAMNQQPWEFYVVNSDEKLEELRLAYRYTGYNGPLAIIVAGNMNEALQGEMKEFWVQDTSAATENILLSAVDLGLGAVWCGIYPIEPAVKNVQKILGVPEYIVPLNVIYVGHPLEAVEPRDQYNKDKVHYL